VLTGISAPFQPEIAPCPVAAAPPAASSSWLAPVPAETAARNGTKPGTGRESAFPWCLGNGCSDTQAEEAAACHWPAARQTAGNWFRAPWLRGSAYSRRAGLLHRDACPPTGREAGRTAPGSLRLSSGSIAFASSTGARRQLNGKASCLIGAWRFTWPPGVVSGLRRL